MCEHKLIDAMPLHTTNYQHTFIAVADDCPALKGEIPPIKNESPTIASIQFGMIADHPYKHTSDEVIFKAFAIRNDLIESDYDKAWQAFFSKGQACLRSSPLAKRYGWGFHFNGEGKVAMYGLGSDEYNQLLHTPGIKVVKAMRSKR